MIRVVSHVFDNKTVDKQCLELVWNRSVLK